MWARLKVPRTSVGPELAKGPFHPLPSFETLLGHPARTKMATGASRVGKSLHAALGEAVPWSLHSDLIWIVAPKYRLARQEFIFTYQALRSLKHVAEADVSLPARDMTARMHTRFGCEIATQTTHDLEELVAEAPDLVIVCEPGLMEEDVLNAMRIRLMTRRGVMFIAGTLKRANPWVGNAYLRWRRWPNVENAYAQNVPLWENLYDFPGARQDEEILSMEKVLPRTRFMEEIAGIPMRAEDLVFSGTWKPQLKDGTDWHIRDCPFQKYVSNTSVDLEPVKLWVDPGYGTGRVYALCFLQFKGPKVWQIDEICESGVSQNEMIRMARQTPYWPNVDDIVVDPWAARSHVFGADSPQEVWEKAARGKPGLRASVRAEIRGPVEDGIQTINEYLLGEDGLSPQFFMDKYNCGRSQWEFEHWRRVKVTGKPDDLNCDCLKAIAAGLMHKNLEEYGDESAPQVVSYGVRPAGPSRFKGATVSGVSRGWP